MRIYLKVLIMVLVIMFMNGIIGSTMACEPVDTQNYNNNENSNKNTNLNTNVNSNKQGQIQGQAQGQVQVQGQGQLQGQSTNVNIDSHDIDRDFPNAAVISLPGTGAGFYVRPSKDSSFRNIKELLSFYNRFTEGACEKLAAGGSSKIHLQILNDENQIARAEADDNGDRWIKIVLVKPDEPFKMTGLIDGEAKNGGTNSFQVLGAMALKAIADGNNILYITNEDQHRMVEASGWGIGLYTVGAKVSRDGMNGGVAGGGLGWATNKSMTEDKPWYHGFVGVVK